MGGAGSLAATHTATNDINLRGWLAHSLFRTHWRQPPPSTFRLTGSPRPAEPQPTNFEPGFLAPRPTAGGTIAAAVAPGDLTPHGAMGPVWDIAFAAPSAATGSLEGPSAAALPAFHLPAFSPGDGVGPGGPASATGLSGGSESSGGSDAASAVEPVSPPSLAPVSLTGGVPEPGTWMMLAGGLFCVGGALRTRRARCDNP